jgi:hypothetical protein
MQQKFKVTYENGTPKDLPELTYLRKNDQQFYDEEGNPIETYEKQGGYWANEDITEPNGEYEITVDSSEEIINTMKETFEAVEPQDAEIIE